MGVMNTLWSVFEIYSSMCFVGDAKQFGFVSFFILENRTICL